MQMWPWLTLLLLSHVIYLELFFATGILSGLSSFVRGTFLSEGIHIVCCIESIEEQCLEQDRALRTATGLIMQKIIATETSVLQAARCYSHWYVLTPPWGLFGILVCIHVLANCTKIK